MPDLENLKLALARVFSLLFLVLSISLIGMAVIELFTQLAGELPNDAIAAVISAINILFVGLATFELGVGIGHEYAGPQRKGDVFFVVRRTITRFVGVVVIALALEGLVMVIKYSQLDLAGNLYYPVAIIISAGVLLTSMGAFLALTRRDSATQGGV
jgi:hypothetical protein